MEIACTEWVTVTDSSSVGEVRRTALSVAQRLAFDETRSGELALLGSEAARNVLTHGGGGHVVVAGTRERRGAMARILALDRGAGIPDLPRAMADGYSTAGTMGGGLGAMKRIASFLDVFSGKSGTVVMLEVGEAFQPERLQIAGLAVPYPGESVCGDGWSYQSDQERTQVVLVDGLGHGFGAAEAAHEALSTFQAGNHSGPGRILEDMHDPLRKTRGAVVGVAEIRPRENSLTFAGVGNISCSMLSNGRSRSFVSHNGTLGLRMSRVQEFHSEWPPDAVLVLHSDGLLSRWDLSPYAGILSRHAAIIAGVLLRDFRRQRDDASVVVVKAA